jgi:2-keto-3-deoxy-L-rhamnonate aldolase RhmA
MKPNPIRQCWHSGHCALGTFIFSTDAATVEIAGASGFDFAVIDLEHAPLGIADAAHHVRAANAAGIGALARVPHADAGTIGRLLDLGAHGIMLAHFGRDVEAARAFGAMLRYAPKGERPSCTGVRAADYGLANFGSYVAEADRDLIGIGLIEDIEVLPRLDALLADTGLDAVMPGPGDLATSMGLYGQPGHPRVRQAVREVIDAARRAGIRAGMYLNSPAEITDWLPHGLDIFVYLIDTKVLAQAYAGAAAAMRAALPTARPG